MRLGQDGRTVGPNDPTTEGVYMQAFRANKEAPTSQKIRGGYYPPRALADYLCP